MEMKNTDLYDDEHGKMKNERKKKNWPREMDGGGGAEKWRWRRGRSWRIKLRERRMGIRKVAKFSLYTSLSLFLISFFKTS